MSHPKQSDLTALFEELKPVFDYEVEIICPKIDNQYGLNREYESNEFILRFKDGANDLNLVYDINLLQGSDNIADTLKNPLKLYFRKEGNVYYYTVPLSDSLYKKMLDSILPIFELNLEGPSAIYHKPTQESANTVNTELEKISSLNVQYRREIQVLKKNVKKSKESIYVHPANSIPVLIQLRHFFDNIEGTPPDLKLFFENIEFDFTEKSLNDIKDYEADYNEYNVNLYGVFYDCIKSIQNVEKSKEDLLNCYFPGGIVVGPDGKIQNMFILYYSADSDGKKRTIYELKSTGDYINKNADSKGTLKQSAETLDSLFLRHDCRQPILYMSELLLLLKYNLQMGGDNGFMPVDLFAHVYNENSKCYESGILPRKIFNLSLEKTGDGKYYYDVFSATQATVTDYDAATPHFLFNEAFESYDQYIYGFQPTLMTKPDPFSTNWTLVEVPSNPPNYKDILTSFRLNATEARKMITRACNTLLYLRKYYEGKGQIEIKYDESIDHKNYKRLYDILLEIYKTLFIPLKLAPKKETESTEAQNVRAFAEKMFKYNSSSPNAEQTDINSILDVFLKDDDFLGTNTNIPNKNTIEKRVQLKQLQITKLFELIQSGRKIGVLYTDSKPQDGFTIDLTADNYILKAINAMFHLLCKCNTKNLKNNCKTPEFVDNVVGHKSFLELMKSNDIPYVKLDDQNIDETLKNYQAEESVAQAKQNALQIETSYGDKKKKLGDLGGRFNQLLTDAINTPEKTKLKIVKTPIYDWIQEIVASPSPTVLQTPPIVDENELKKKPAIFPYTQNLDKLYGFLELTKGTVSSPRPAATPAATDNTPTPEIVSTINNIQNILSQINYYKKTIERLDGRLESQSVPTTPIPKIPIGFQQKSVVRPSSAKSITSQSSTLGSKSAIAKNRSRFRGGTVETFRDDFQTAILNQLGLYKIPTTYYFVESVQNLKHWILSKYNSDWINGLYDSEKPVDGLTDPKQRYSYHRLKYYTDYYSIYYQRYHFSKIKPFLQTEKGGPIDNAALLKQFAFVYHPSNKTQSFNKQLIAFAYDSLELDTLLHFSVERDIRILTPVTLPKWQSIENLQEPSTYKLNSQTPFVTYYISPLLDYYSKYELFPTQSKDYIKSILLKKIQSEIGTKTIDGLSKENYFLKITKKIPSGKSFKVTSLKMDTDIELQIQIIGGNRDAAAAAYTRKKYQFRNVTFRAGGPQPRPNLYFIEKTEMDAPSSVKKGPRAYSRRSQWRKYKNKSIKA